MEKKNTFRGLVLVGAIILGILQASTTYSQTQVGQLSQIILYKGDAAGTGTGLNSFKLTVGEEMKITAKGVDAEGNEVNIWPTWKADKELSIQVVEGRSKTIVVKALKAGAPLFISAIYITDEGKKVKGEVMGEVKAMQ